MVEVLKIISVLILDVNVLGGNKMIKELEDIVLKNIGKTVLEYDKEIEDDHDFGYIIRIFLNDLKEIGLIYEKED